MKKKLSAYAASGVDIDTKMSALSAVKKLIKSTSIIGKARLPAGWDIYPIGSRAKPAEMPKGMLAGIVIVH